ncbi:MAG: GxxExxY protein [Prevotella sp.]|jgi:GxxExxY protein|nr:GxxExxY protein [Prevotella sp.]MBR6997324.1 GxxExxY protein [Prevotella sp.]
MDAIELKNAVANCAKRVRSQLTPGFEEKVYQNAMVIELKDSGLNVETEVPIKVYYKDHVVGDYRADLIVEKKMIVELKAVSAILPIHEVQLVNYLTATGIDSGMLINFGSDIIEIRYRTRIYKIKP